MPSESSRRGADLTKLDDASLANHLYTRGLPDPDLVSARPAKCDSAISCSGSRLLRVLQYSDALARFRRCRLR